MACITMFSVHSESRLGLFDSVHYHLHLHRHSLVILAEEIGNRQFSPGRGDGLFHRLGLDYCRVTYHLASPVNLVFRRQGTVEHRTRIGMSMAPSEFGVKKGGRAPSKMHHFINYK